MTDNLPVPVAPAAGVPPTDTLVAALAMAAARIAAEQRSAAEQARSPVAGPLTRDDVEAIARAAVVEAFKQFDIDLDKVESVQAHRSVLDHARRSKAFWEKGSGTIWNGVWAAIGTALIAAVVKYTGFGGAR